MLLNFLNFCLDIPLPTVRYCLQLLRMGPLEDFGVRVKDMIKVFSLNVSVSGVALIVNEAKETVYSVSLIVDGQGVIPQPDGQSVMECKSILQKCPVCKYSLRYVQFVCALVKDEKLLRWQAQYAAMDEVQACDV